MTLTLPFFATEEAPAYKGACLLSPCGQYRYWLSRRWEPVPSRIILWVLLNPSTATDDVQKDDPTIRKVVGFSKRWGFDELVVVNLFARRSSRPRALLLPGDPIGSENDTAIADAAVHASMTITAWGMPSGGGVQLQRLVAQRAFHVFGLLSPRPLHYLALTKDEHPRHPLFLPGALEPKAWRDYR